MRFWDETMFVHWGRADGKIACAFSSFGGGGGGAEMACQSLLTVLMNFGFLVFAMADDSGKTMTSHYGAIAAQTPHEKDVQGAWSLAGRRLAEWVAVMVGGRKE